MFSYLFSVFMLFLLPQDSDNSKFRIANDYVVVHNQASKGAVLKFIKKYHRPEDVSVMDLDKHIAFYNHIIKDFGPLNPQMYKIEEETETKLIVHFIKSNIDINDSDIDPVDILQVEIDVYKSFPEYLSRGLGLGALACSR